MLRNLIMLVGLLFAQASHAVSSITISADSIEHAQVTLKNPQLNIDLNKAQLKLTTQAKRQKDAGWTQAKLLCDIPKKLRYQTFQCHQGLAKSEKLNVPFSLNVTPSAKGAVAQIQLQSASFSDTSGLHAADQLTGDLDIDFVVIDGQVHWQQQLKWTQGEVFWDPFYIKGGGHTLHSSGQLLDDVIQLDQVQLALKDIGQLELHGAIQREGYGVQSLNASWRDFDLATAYPVFFKPLLTQSMLNQAELGGTANLDFSIEDQELKQFHLKLKDVNIDDKNRKFAFYNLQADIPWSYDDERTVNISYQNGQLLNVPLGKTDVSMTVNRYALTTPEIELPLLDGALRLKDISAARIAGYWHWHLGADILPIDMSLMSNALQWPGMQGTLLAQVPQVTYSGGLLTVNGDMLFKVFDGELTVTNLTMHQPLSDAPIMHSDLYWHDVDLGTLTKTFEFGGIEGRIDGEIKDLEMVDWQLTKMDAKLHSSQGRYPKKISQRAVENISALGGAGAAAAIQRSFLRFFENFNYKKLGWSCLLKNNICKMGGVESTDQGYIIVKGSGIPAINVKGYNQSVAWDELIARIKRITDENTKAVVQ